MMSAPAREHDELFRTDTNRGTGRACPHARGTAVEILAHVALHGALGRVGFRFVMRRFAGSGSAPQQEPRPQARPRRRRALPLNDVVWTVALEVAAADAVVADVDLAVGRASNRVGRAILHA